MSELISGKEALIAIANGQEVECRAYEKNWINANNKHHPLSLFFDDSFQFRLKPRTIMIGNIEVPAPFDPKDGDEVWFLNDDSERGYGCSAEYDKDIKSYFGWWRTEEEIRQVVAALCEVFK